MIIPETIVGRASGTSNISGMFLVDVTTANSVLTVRNPADNTTALAKLKEKNMNK